MRMLPGRLGLEAYLACSERIVGKPHLTGFSTELPVTQARS